MKLTGFLLLAAILQVSAHARGQTVTYSAKEVPLLRVLQAFEKQTGFSFFYDLKDLEASRPVTVELKGVPIKEALEVVFVGQPLGYEVQGNTVAVVKRETIPVAAPAPPGEVKGRVTDSVGNPLAGVSVTVKGSARGVTTDGKGEFVITGVAGDAVLAFSNVGYGKQEVRLEGRSTLTVQLRVAVETMQDAVVNKGYYSVRQRENTGNVSIVDTKTIEEQPVTDPIQALIGRVPGLNLQQASGVPGAVSNVQLRGVNSLINGNVPLYLVDGVPFSGTPIGESVTQLSALGHNPGSVAFAQPGGMSPFSALNMSDIESIEVLKDADATAIYGSRGANGVILITTKKGKGGATRFNLDVKQGSSEVARDFHLMNTQQYLMARREATRNDGLALPNINTDPSDYNYDIDGAWDTTRYTNWQKVLIGNKAEFTDLQGSLSGGNTNTQFLIGGGYTRQGTVYLGNYSDEKASANFHLTHISADRKFNMQISSSFLRDNSQLPGGDFTGDLALEPDAPPLYDKSGNINWQIVGGVATFTNPIALTYIRTTAVTNNLLGSLNMGYQLAPGLEIKSLFGFNYDRMGEDQVRPSTSYAPPNNTNPMLRRHIFANDDVNSWNIEPQLNYHRPIGAGKLDVLVGTTFEKSAYRSLPQLSSGFTSDALISNPAAASSTVTLGSANYTQYAHIAVYGQAAYNWRSRYILNVTARRDGSSRFGPGRQFGDFGALGAAWIFSSERFIQRALPHLSFGKLRSSYGTSGNDQIGDYQYLSTYSVNSSHTYMGAVGLTPTSLTNPDLAWELVRKLEFGLELGFFNDRLNVAASYYRNRTGNQLTGLPLPYITGFTTVPFNQPAVVQNTGWELELHSVNIRAGEFTWRTDVNLTFPQSKLVSFPDISKFPRFLNSLVVGQSLFIQHDYHSTGVNPQTGLYSFGTHNVNGEPSYPQDLVLTKPVTQTCYGGIQNSFSYKGLALDVFLQYVHQSATDFRYQFAYPGADGNIPTAFLGRWQKPGDRTDIQRFGTFNSLTIDPSGFFGASDGAIADASFLRVKTVALSYTLPAKWKQKMHLQNMRIYVNAQNLFVVTPYKVFDPETPGLGLPPLRTVIAGIQVGL